MSSNSQIGLQNVIVNIAIVGVQKVCHGNGNNHGNDGKCVKEQKGKTIANTILMPSFWNTIIFSLKVSSPLICVLHLVDSERKDLMRYIYEAMNRAKETIVRSFNRNEDKYKEIFKIINKIWRIRLHQALHEGGYFLNWELFYDKPKLKHNANIIDNLYKCNLRLT